jgi:hypothetical protein
VCSIRGSRDSIDSVATYYGVDILEFEHWALWPTQPPVQWVPGLFLRDKVALTIHLLMALSRALPLPPLCAFVACCSVTFTFVEH